MKRHLMIVIALGLVATGCKKDEKAKDGDKPASGSASGSEKASGSDGPSGSGSAVASGTGMASASGTGTASGTDVVTDVGTGSGTGAGTGTAVATGDANVSPPGGDVTLTWETPPVGFKFDKSETEHVEMTFGGTPVTLDKTKLRHMEVIESGEFITKLKVHVEADHELQTAEGKQGKKTEPTEGKTYLVWKEGGTIAASLEDGSAISPEELEELSGSFDDEIGVKPGIVKVLLAHAWKTGEETTLASPDLEWLTEDLKKGAKVDAAKVTLKSTEANNSVFVLWMDLTLSGEATGTSSGTATIVLDNKPLRPSILEGEIAMDATIGANKMVGKSTQSTKYTYR